VSVVNGVLVALVVLAACGSEVLRLREWPGERVPIAPFRDLRRGPGAVVLGVVAAGALVGVWMTATGAGSSLLAVALAFGSSVVAVAVHDARVDRGHPARRS